MGFEDRLDAPAIYMGWYRQHAYGPWSLPRWSVPPGAIGFHLHSFSATTVRSAERGWLGPLVRQGYCATFGNVFEPYLEYTHRPQVVLQHLLGGGNFGDAVMQANPVLSWQTVAIGDPLYRPFSRDLLAETPPLLQGPFATYHDLRRINQVAAGEGAAQALIEGRARFAELPSAPLALRLSELFVAEGRQREAASLLQFMRYIDRFPVDEVGLARRIADQLHRLGETALALELYQKMLADRQLPPGLREATLRGGLAIAEAAGDGQLTSRWSLELQSKP
jgi:hypothetical protein